jgi:hypothetical protein
MDTPGAAGAQSSHHGACLCGAIRYDVDGSLATVVLCHCTQCRRGNGGAFNVGVVVAADQVTFRSRATLKEFESSPGKLRAFCSACGSPVYSRRPDTPGVLRLRGGLIIDLPAPADLRHIHRDSRWPWIDTIEAAPKSGGG